MAKFIKVTIEATGLEVFLNVDQIVRFGVYYHNQNLTSITFVGSGHADDQNYIVVKESVAEVLKLIGE